MQKRETRIVNLTEGGIFQALIRLALPIIGTSFVQMAYSLTDMIWVGRVGSGGAVAAVGAAGFFTWLANAIILVPKIGGQRLEWPNPSAAANYRKRSAISATASR